MNIYINKSATTRGSGRDYPIQIRDEDTGDVYFLNESSVRMIVKYMTGKMVEEIKHPSPDGVAYIEGYQAALDHIKKML